MKRYSYPDLHRQSGAALMFSLIFLLALTIIGMTAMQSSTLQERMAGNIRDLNLAFQAAENALREGEHVMDSPTSKPSFVATGPYRMPLADATSAKAWSAYAWSDATSKKIAGTFNGISADHNPRYVVEELGSATGAGSSGSAIDFESKLKMDEPIVYRITSRGLGSTGKTTVILQSTFRNHL